MTLVPAGARVLGRASAVSCCRRVLPDDEFPSCWTWGYRGCSPRAPAPGHRMGTTLGAPERSLGPPDVAAPPAPRLPRPQRVAGADRRPPFRPEDGSRWTSTNTRRAISSSATASRLRASSPPRRPRRRRDDRRHRRRQGPGQGGRARQGGRRQARALARGGGGRGRRDPRDGHQGPHGPARSDRRRGEDRGGVLLLAPARPLDPPLPRDVFVEGGVEIEVLAAERPEALAKVDVDPQVGIDAAKAAEIVAAAGFAPDDRRSGCRGDRQARRGLRRGGRDARRGEPARAHRGRRRSSRSTAR